MKQFESMLRSQLEAARCNASKAAKAQSLSN